MGPGLAANIRSRREQLRWLSVVFLLEIRLKIVAELYMRPMSPKEFYSEFGGRSLSRVSQQFTFLAEHGWLRPVGLRERATKRRGPSETIYRATEAPFLDAEMWAMLPYSIRLASSWNLFKATAGELREGLKAAVAGERKGWDLTCMSLELDGLGWNRVIKALDSHFESVFAEQEDAKIRAAEGNDPLLRIGVFQAGFESPRSPDRGHIELAGGLEEPLIPFPERLGPVFADDLLLQILEELNKTPMSVRQFHREHASDVSEWIIRHRFERLKKLGWIAIVDRIPKRGAEEHVYRATRPIVHNDGPWANAPDALERSEAWVAFERISTLAKHAIVGGTFDIRDDRHLSWSIVGLDEQGLEKVVADIGGLVEFVDREQQLAAKRIEGGSVPLSMVVGFSVAESPVSPVEAL